MSQQFDLDRFEECYIHHKARQLVGKAGFLAADLDDIKQDLRADVLQRLDRFKPGEVPRHAFVVLVVGHCVATMLERRRTAKRNVGRRPESLNAPVRDGDGKDVELYETLAPGTGESGRRGGELHDLAFDVQAVVRNLPAEQQRWCAILGGMGIREASRSLGVPRTHVQRIVREIREAFNRAGLKDYFQGK